MTTTNRSIVAGVFADEQHAQQAMADLQDAGFRENQIRYSPHKSGANILDALSGIGLEQEEAAYYNTEFQQGRTIVTVKDNARQQEAATIMQRNGAYDASRRMSQTSGATEEVQPIQLREERLQATTERVQTGEVDLRNEVVTEQQTLDVPVTHEEVYIERRAGSGQVFDTPIGEGEAIRVPVSAEQVNVAKQTVQTGEVSVGKRAVQETQQVTDTVRHEEARIERKGDAIIEGDDTGVQDQ
jgi:uncharacterized protein (TIGR02271 family)